LGGGIKRWSQDGQIVTNLPIISKIPYVSRLFKNVGVGRETRSLMLMVTPRIIIQEKLRLSADSPAMDADVVIGFDVDGVTDVAAQGVVPIDPLQMHEYALLFDPVGTYLELFIDNQLALAGDTSMPFDLTGPVGIQMDITGASAFVDNIVLEDVPAIPEPSTFALALIGLLSLSMFGRRRRRR
jgi:hypothetical protein